jgi:FtsP/CotA-like multicopper oxidase with cupredoxin domain
MPEQCDRRQIQKVRRICAASVVATMLFGATATFAGNFVEPQVFASSQGLLDLLMIALPQPVPSISYFPPNSSSAINPTGWVYEICPRSTALPGNQCPSGAPTVSDYGGVRLALQKGDTLKIRLVNRLPLLNPIKVNHSVDPGGTNLPLNLTNLHTHGLIVSPRTPTLTDPTFGDNVFVEIYNSANGTPQPQGRHQHGSLVKDYVDYRIDIPENHPSGAFWFHPHLHGIALNQVSSGLAGIISIGSAGDYAFGDLFGTPFPESSVRHLILKDIQVLPANPAQLFSNGVAPTVDGEVLNQQASPFCNQNRAKEPPRQGSCPGLGPNDDVVQKSGPSPIKAGTWGNLGGTYQGGRWYFTISGQQYPTIQITEPDGELWRLTNASGSVTYNLQLTNDADLTPMMMQLVSVDGVSINVPPATPLGTMAQLGGARFKVVACPPSSAAGLSSAPVCVDEFAMMPSSRAELWVTYRDQSGQIVTPPAGATGTFRTTGITTGAVGDAWPTIDLATVAFTQTGPRRFTASALDIRGDARATNLVNGIFSAPVPNAKAAPAPARCKALASGHRRRIFFGFVDTNNPDVFGLGYEEVDANGAVVEGTQIPISNFDPAITTVCLPLGPRQAPVRETWELVNLATENHNFHIHQTKFRLVQNGAAAGSPLAPTLDPSIGAGVMEDNVPLPVAIANISDVANLQYGYCTIAQWRNGQCTSVPVVVEIPFSQIGEFVYHCHILAHEDGGMMAKIQVVPWSNPTNTISLATHDFNGDGHSDIAWRNTDGDVAIWLMGGAQIVSAAGLGNAPSNWTIVGTGDFNGDGKSDILWRNTNGDVGIWLMNGTQVSSAVVVGNVPTNWTIVGTGDFNGDGFTDILWRDTSGNLAIWLMNGTQVLLSVDLGNVPTNWTIVGTGDFNGDGKSDILWRDTSGNVGIWLMNGQQVLSKTVIGNVPASWTIVGTGDFNGDGKSDILWRDTSGYVATWFMNGTQISSAAGLGNVPTNWTIVETGDYYGAGTSDIMWTDTSGDLAIWQMNGATILSSIGLGNVPTVWTIQNTNTD